MSNLICIFTRKHLDSDLCEIRAATPKAKKEEKKTQEKKKNSDKASEHNERVLRSYRLR